MELTKSEILEAFDHDQKMLDKLEDASDVGALSEGGDFEKSEVLALLTSMHGEIARLQEWIAMWAESMEKSWIGIGVPIPRNALEALEIEELFESYCDKHPGMLRGDGIFQPFTGYAGMMDIGEAGSFDS